MADVPTPPTTRMPDFSGFGEFRMTKQRRVVYDVLVDEPRDHPTASEVFLRAKNRMPGISLATVYNCLETLTHAGLVKQVNLDRDASRYCPNLKPHAHFFCSECEQVFDITPRPSADPCAVWELPEGTRIDHLDVTLKGKCPACARAGHP
ncbi:MAG: transcriptional repressor [Verrucomicrobiae bacterium]|nr:transcriptional repressor [Verrucomicrobiae bacterium]MCP5541122.1 transcriptional repressor [Akkermansiaceae bacterium]MCP5551243.1 transcriptional repressor [Akkermansiaceae bacterium]